MKLLQNTKGSFAGYTNIYMKKETYLMNNRIKQDCIPLGCEPPAH